MKSNKQQYNFEETSILTEVTKNDDGYDLTWRDGMMCLLSNKNNPKGVVPKKGDKFTLHMKDGAFGTIRGMDLNGEKIYFKTDEQLDKEREYWLLENEEQKQRELKENKEKMDAQYDALPKVFQERIDKFRENNKRFRVDYESYELFCCEQAVVIAKACETHKKVEEFIDMDWDEQKEVVPELSSGHSGNTFGASVSLAFWYLKEEKNVVKLHGALATLVGSKEYGDISKEELEDEKG